MKAISIFSGIDCLGIGFSKYFNIITAIEKEKMACETLKINAPIYHPDLQVINRDLYEMKDEEITHYKNKYDVLFGGPPCQPFSPAKSVFNPNDERIKGLSEYARWVELTTPKAFLFENTSGLTHKAKSLILESFKESLSNLGYDIYSSILCARDYGSVQNRKRIIVIGIKKELGIKYVFPVKKLKHKYVRDIIKDEPLEECLFYSPKREHIISYVPEGGNWRDLPNEDLKKQALGNNYEKREGGMTGVYKRLDRNSYCPTLTTNPLQRNTMMCHPTENRPLSIKESKRAQGIPEDYVILGTTAEKYKFIGNGVPVEMASALAMSLYDAFQRTY